MPRILAQSSGRMGCDRCGFGGVGWPKVYQAPSAVRTSASCTVAKLVVWSLIE